MQIRTFLGFINSSIDELNLARVPIKMRYVHVCTSMYMICTCLYKSKRVYICIYMYIYVWTMYIHVYTSECTYHVRTMYIRVCTFAEMYIRVCTCLWFSLLVYTMSVSCCTIALYIHCTYMVQTCLYTFMPGGQDSRCSLSLSLSLSLSSCLPIQRWARAGWQPAASKC